MSITAETLQNDPRTVEINRAIAAHQRLAAGERVSKKDLRSIDGFRNLYRDVFELKQAPDIREALKSTLEKDLGFLIEVPNNKLLSQHLKKLLNKGSATEADLGTIQSLAGQLSLEEDDAISATLARLAINGGLDKAALEKIEPYLGTERTARAQFMKRQRRRSNLLAAGTVIATAVLLPVLAWGPVGNAVVENFGVQAAQILQTGSLFAGLIGGTGAGSLIRRSRASRPFAYGVES